jgi:hypothetical protein
MAFWVTVDGNTDFAQFAVFTWDVNEDFQLMVELLELVPLKWKTSADEISSELVALFSRYELAWEKWLGLLAMGLQL